MKYSLFIKGIFLFLIISALAGCASIVSKGHEDIDIASTPSGANIKITETHTGELVYTGTAPSTVELEKGSGFFQGASYQVEITADGYAPQTFTIDSSVNVFWYGVGNLFFGWFVGWLIVDPITGAMWNLDPEVIESNLTVSSNSNNADTHSLHIVLLEDVPEDARLHMEPIF